MIFSYVIQRRRLLEAKVDGLEVDAVKGGGHLAVGTILSTIAVHQPIQKLPDDDDDVVLSGMISVDS